MNKFGMKTLEFKMKYSDKIFDFINVMLMCVLLIIFIWPLWFVVIASFSDPIQVYAGNVLLIPKGITFESYKKIMDYEPLWIGYRNTFFYTIVGTLLNVVMTVCAAYPLSRNEFAARKLVFTLLMITMYFGGGLIPTYMVVRKLGLINSPWVMIIPGACSVYNVLITRTYFKNSIPDSLFEAAKLDGANSLQTLLKVALPLSKPILAVIGLYYAVGHWNDYYTALFYLRDRALLPLQSALRDILMSTKITNEMSAALQMSEGAISQQKLALTMRYSVIIVSTAPVLAIYPFIQKHFVKGIMIGSLKG